ncbi:MAG: GTP-binding protein, partial [Pseudomonadota bacterium]
MSGFLGAGKSTLLNRFLSDASFGDTAVIINEFGDVPVDHLLVRQGETTISQVSSGCLCCSSTSDIRTTLLDLHYAATHGDSVGFSRVIVEMSGLGDPAPLVNALAVKHDDAITRNHELADDAFYIAGFITLFDVVAGMFSIENHFEVLKQVAFADRIVLTKTDLLSDKTRQADIEKLSDELRSINSSAQIVNRQEVDLDTLFSPRPYSVVEQGEDVLGWLALEEALAAEAKHVHNENTEGNPSRHGDGIRTFSIVGDNPLPEKRVQEFLSILRSSAGPRLLRVKGIIATEESPEHPLIIHAVQHIMSEPVRLDAWPDEDHRTRLVFITSNIDPDKIRELFEAIINPTPFSFTKFAKEFGSILSKPFTKSLSTFSIQSR